MGTTNRCTLAALDKMDAAEIPQDQLEMLLEDAADLKAKYDRYNKKLFAEMDRRFGGVAAEARRKAKKDTGTVRVVVDGATVKADLPKKVAWDQAELARKVDVVRGWNSGPIEDYVTITYNVPESKYNAWPTSIREVFEPARTVSCGKPTYEFVKDAA